MKRLTIIAVAFVALGLTFSSCKKEGCTDATATNYDPKAKKDDGSCIYPAPATYKTEDQMGRPGINTVFIPSARKDEFNTTLTHLQKGAFSGDFKASIKALNPSYSTNVLGWNDQTMADALSADALGVNTTAATNFGTLNGRALSDDVIDVAFLLTFGGPSGSDNPTLTSDNVDANDKTFSNAFPYLADPF